MAEVDQPPMELASPEPVIEIKAKPLDLGIAFRQKGSDIIVSDLLTKYKLLAIFFGKPDCSITKTFLPVLKQFYEEVNLEQKELEVLYIGVSRNQQENSVFAKNMPWLAMPLTDSRAKDVREFYKIRSVPQLVVLRRNGSVLEANGRSDIQQQGEEAIIRWLEMKSLSDMLIEK